MRSWSAAALVVGLLSCHEEGGGCHWPWARGDGDGDGGTAEYGEACADERRMSSSSSIRRMRLAVIRRPR